MENFIGTSFVSLIIIILLCGLLYGCPQYDVYASRLSGQAQLAEAESNRKIAIEEAEAKKQSAQALSEAEVIGIVNGLHTDLHTDGDVFDIELGDRIA